MVAERAADVLGRFGIAALSLDDVGKQAFDDWWRSVRLRRAAVAM
jgi:hypothetical protein